MANFIKSVLKAVATLIVAYFVLFALLFIVLIGIGVAFEEKPQTIKDDTVLVLDISFNLTEKPMGEDPSQLVRQALSGEIQPTIHLRKLLKTLEDARNDPSISGLLIVGNTGNGFNFANIQEIANAIRSFGKFKPTYSVIDSDTVASLFIKTAAGTVFSQPDTVAYFQGLRAEMLYLGKAFEQVGIDVQVLKTGPFKSAGETFSEEKMSPENRKQLAALINDIWTSIREEIAFNRGLTSEDLNELANTSPILMGEDILKAGLADELKATDQIIELFEEKFGYDEAIDSFNQVDLFDYQKARAPVLPISFESGNKVAVVYASGTVVDGEGEIDQIGGDSLSRTLRAMRKDNDVKAVVLRVDTPGGSATAASKIGREIELLNEKKPVVVSMGGVAASAGYWISAKGEVIFAEPTTITGSIGVIAILPNIEELSGKLNLNFESVQTNEMAGIFGISEKRSKKQIDVFGEYLWKTYHDFITIVSEGRNMPTEAVEAIAGGRVWSGLAAVDNGLVDRLGGLNMAIQEAADLASLGDDYIIIDRPREKTLEEVIEDLFSNGFQAASPSLLESEIGRRLQNGAIGDMVLPLLQDLEMANSLNDPQKVYGLMPFSIHIK